MRKMSEEEKQEMSKGKSAQEIMVEYIKLINTPYHAWCGNCSFERESQRNRLYQILMEKTGLSNSELNQRLIDLEKKLVNQGVIKYWRYDPKKAYYSPALRKLANLFLGQIRKDKKDKNTKRKNKEIRKKRAKYVKKLQEKHPEIQFRESFED